MKRRSFVGLFVLAASVSLWMGSGCSVVRHVPESESLLVENRMAIQRELSNRQTRQMESELTKYIRQKPNKRILGVPVFLMLYNVSSVDTMRNGFLNRWFRKVGQPPVVYDSLLSAKSADQMELYLKNCGYFNAVTGFEAQTRRRRTRVKYTVKEGKPYTIGKISYDFQDKFLEPIVLADTAQSLLHAGEDFNLTTLSSERQRIASYLQNIGYYFFSINDISYVADTSSSDRIVALTMLIKQRQAGFAPDGTPITGNHKLFRIRNIYVNVNYNPATAFNDEEYRESLDTVEYRGVYFIAPGRMNVRPDVLMRSINLYPNDLYDARQVKKSYDNLLQLNYFKTANFTFSTVADTSNANNLVTYFDSHIGKTIYTEQAYLDLNINCTPSLKQGYKLEFEAATSANFYGIKATTGYRNRNLFRGMEIFEVNVTGGYDIMRTEGRRNSYELGVSTGMTFPGFWSPIKIDRYNRLNMPRTKLEVSVNTQNRPNYNRILSSAGITYSWSGARFSHFSFKPIELALVKINSIDSSFLQSLKSQYLRESYRNQLIVGLGASYYYNNQLSNTATNSLSLRINMESSGNLLSLFSNYFGRKYTEDQTNVYRVFGIRYSQYIRTDATFTYRFITSPRTQLVYRLYGGIGAAYGNSISLPFDRLFYCGGSNGMRGWQVRTLGPGNTYVSESDYPSQQGNLKLETNLEFRFPVSGILYGALFCDVGNVWLTGKHVDDPAARFRFNTFYKQLGFDSGVGARLDFGFFLLRLDWGVKIHNPSWPQGERWIRHLTLRNTALNFGVGYPF